MPRFLEARRSFRTDGVALLPVRTRRTLCGHAPMTTASTVHCPRRGEAVDADECFTCAHFTGVVPHGRDAAIRCAGVGTPDELCDGIDAETTSVQAVMSRDVVCVTPGTGIDAVATLLIERGYSGVPVVDASGVPVGVVSKTDLVRASREIEPHERDERCVGDIMMPVAFSLAEDATLGMVASMMACEGVHRVPVVDAAGRIVGIVTTLDLVRWIARVGARDVTLDEYPLDR
jgi:CBS domain-containing protein